MLVMAVTQQLARLPDELLTRCSKDLLVFEDALSGKALDEVDYLDLDWSPSQLQEAFALVGSTLLSREALHLSTKGVRDVMPGSDGMYSMYVTPTYLDSRDVIGVSVALRQIEVDSLLTEEIAAAVIGEDGPADPRSYLVQHFLALRAFYAGAAERGLAVMMWWD